MARVAARFVMLKETFCSARKRTKSDPRHWFLSARNRRSAFLAIGSADADRFHPGMSMDFLSRLGDLVAEALKRY